MIHDHYTAQDAIDMLIANGANCRRELLNISAAYIDAIEDIEAGGSTAGFAFSEFKEALILAAATGLIP